MWIFGLFLAIASVWERLVYLSEHGREDIYLFADFAAR